MPFKQSDRVAYGKNPLAAVICQLRFPDLLRISSESPVAFQERVRGEYPLFAESPQGGLPPGVPPKLRDVLLSQFGPGLTRTSYQFSSSDNRWKLSLDRGFIALTDGAYTRWEHFRTRFETALKTFDDIYKPGLYTRVGLRYRNVIQRSALGLKDEPWRELLQPHIAGEMIDPKVEAQTLAATRTVVIALPEGQVRVTHGLAIAEDESARTKETVYVIDSDFFAEPPGHQFPVWDLLERFHHHSGNLFRWCIGDRLHRAMEPETIPRAVPGNPG